MNLEKWKNTTLKNYLEKNKLEEEKVCLILHYLESNPTLRLLRMSVSQALVKATQWKQREDKRKSPERMGCFEVIKTYPNGFKIVRLVNEEAKQWEGHYMGHCVGEGGYNNEYGIYSLRDSKDNPHVTFQCSARWVLEISGKKNSEVSKKYVSYILDFFKEKDLFFASSSDMCKIGYHRIDKIDKEFREKNFENNSFFEFEGNFYSSYENNRLVVKENSLMSQIQKLKPSLFKKIILDLSFRNAYRKINNIRDFKYWLEKLIEDVDLDNNKDFLPEILDIEKTYRLGNQELFKKYLTKEFLQTEDGLHWTYSYLSQSGSKDFLKEVFNLLDESKQEGFLSRILHCWLGNNFNKEIVLWLFDNFKFNKVSKGHVERFLSIAQTLEQKERNLILNKLLYGMEVDSEEMFDSIVLNTFTSKEIMSILDRQILNIPTMWIGIVCNFMRNAINNNHDELFKKLYNSLEEGQITKRDMVGLLDLMIRLEKYDLIKFLFSKGVKISEIHTLEPLRIALRIQNKKISELILTTFWRECENFLNSK